MRFEWLVLFVLCGWIIETLVHRWVWNQIPTQMSAVTVYLILAGVSAFVAYRIHRLRSLRFRR